MADVLQLAPSVATEHPAHRRVRIGSRAFAVLFAVLFWGLAALTALGVWVVLFYGGDMVSIGAAAVYLNTDGPPPGAVTFASLTLDHRIAYALVAVVRSAPALVLFWALRALFKLYGRGEVFTVRNATLIQRMGVCLVADALAPFACHVALSATGYEIDRNWMHMASLQGLVLGGLVLVIAQVMLVGREIEEDREQFV